MYTSARRKPLIGPKYPLIDSKQLLRLAPVYAAVV
jgi:hypothetical protein